MSSTMGLTSRKRKNTSPENVQKRAPLGSKRAPTDRAHFAALEQPVRAFGGRRKTWRIGAVGR